MKKWIWKAEWHRRKVSGGFWKRDEGIGTLEIVLIAAVLILLAIAFKDWITEFLEELMGKAKGEAEQIFD